MGLSLIHIWSLGWVGQKGERTCEKGSPERGEQWRVRSAGDCGGETEMTRVINWCWQAVCLAGSHLCQFIYIISNEPGSCLVRLLTLWWKFFTEEANWNRLWTSHLVKLPTLRFKCVVKVAGAEVSHPVAPGCSEKLRMSERCNLKTLTAALCCFYHKNSVITAKVRDRGECVCKDAHVVWQYFVYQCLCDV